MTTLAPEYEGCIWVTRGRSHPGPAYSSATATFQPRQHLGEDQEKEEKAPRAGTTCSAGPGPNTKVTKQSNMQPSLTDDKPLHINGPPGPTTDFRGDTNAADTPYGVNQGHNKDKDPGATDDRRERPQPGPAEGPGQPKKLQQGPPTARGQPNKGPANGYPLPKPQERPHPGLAEGPEQPEKLQQRPPVACQGDSEPSLGCVHWWSKKKKKKKHGKRNLPNGCLIAAVQWLMLLVPTGELQPSAEGKFLVAFLVPGS